MKLRSLFPLFICAVLLPASRASAAPGDLDATFSADGKATVDFGAAGGVYAMCGLTQPDGKIVVGGILSSMSSTSKFALTRFNVNGTVDTGFGAAGKVITTVLSGSARVTGLALQPDGKLLVVGTADAGVNNSDLILARYTAAGALDATFGTGGIASLDFGASGFDEGGAVVVLPDGKIVVAGSADVNGSGDYDFGVARFHSNGTLDTTFGTNGFTTTDLGTDVNDYPSFIALQPDGKVVVVGYSNPANSDFAVARYTSGGILDTSFSGDGKLTTSFSGTDRPGAVKLLADGKILVAGSSGNGNTAALARYEEDGDPDPTFDTDGKLTLARLHDLTQVVMDVQPDGKIVLASINDEDIHILRLSSSGVLDAGFGTGGTVTTGFGAGVEPQVGAVIAQGNGRIAVVAAVGQMPFASDFAALRLEGDPVADLSVELPALTYLQDGYSTAGYGVLLPTGTLTKTFTIRNTGLVALNFDPTPVTVTGTNAADFIVTQPTVIMPLAPGLTRTFTVKVGPTTPGTKTAILHVGSSDLDEDTFDIALTANVSHPVKLGSAGYAVEEGSAATIDLVRQTAGGVVTVEIKSANGTALLSNNDYTPLNQLVTFADGDVVKTVQLQTTDDSTQEAIETLTVTISGGTAVKVAPLSATVRIIDDSAQQQGALAGQDNANPPPPGITSPALNALMPVATGQPMTVTGTATDGKSVEKVEVSFDNATFTPAVLAMPGATSTAYTGTITPVGDPALGYKVYVKTTDYSGRNTTTERIFRVARNLPVELYTELYSPGVGMVTSVVQKGSVTAGFAPSSFREPGTVQTITATPVAGHVFDGWEVSGSSPLAGTPDFSNDANWGLIDVTEASLELPKLTFRMREGLQLKAKFRNTPFIPVAGIYNGLVTSDDSQPTLAGTTPGNSTEGFFTATVQPTGGFSGKLFIDGLELPVSGAFDNDGVARFGTTRAENVKVARPGKPYLEVYLTLTGMDDTDLQNDVITGGVTQKIRGAAVAVSGVRSSRNFYNAAGPATWAPSQFLGPLLPSGPFADQMYTVLLQAMDILDQPAGVFTSESEFPTGHGYASMKLTRGGAVTMVGKLPDGTPLTYSGFATPDAGLVSVPFYVSLYGKAGCITGPMVLETPVETWDPELKQLQYSPAPAYPVLWFRPYQDAQHYQYGWPEGLRMTMEGAKYTVPPTTPLPGSSVLPDVTDGDRAATVKFFGGLLTSSPLTEAIEVSPTEVITELPLDPVFSLTITRATGVISGNFKHSDGTTQPYYGIIHQKGELAADRGGFGFFMSQTPKVKDYLGEGGAVLLQAD